MIHKLKSWPDQFQSTWSGIKIHEVRKADRKFNIGDTLVLREWNPPTEEYTGRECSVEVTYVTHGGNFGLPNDLCCMSIVLTKKDNKFGADVTEIPEGRGKGKPSKNRR